MLPEILLKEMQDSFLRSQDLLDLEMSDDANIDPTLEIKNSLTDIVDEATPEQLGSMLEIFQRLKIGKIQRDDSVPLHAMT